MNRTDLVIGDSWISLEEKLPQQEQFILLYDKMFDKIDVWFVDKDPSLIDEDYTHWLPLPEPPKRAKLKSYTAWCHRCNSDFVSFKYDMKKPDYICPKCKTNDYVTVS